MKTQAICPKIYVLSPSGYLTAANTEQFHIELIEAVTTQNASQFLIDMSRVEFLDSSGLMAIVDACRLAQSLGKQFHLRSLAPSVRMVFELVGLERMIKES